jgi:crotonobetaine/carnitine-CoA ligase
MDIVGSRTLYSTFAAHASLWPDRMWLLFEREDRRVLYWTWREFLDSVHRAANLLHSMGIRAGDVVNLHLTNHPAHPQLILAASHIGAVVVPTNPNSTDDELRYLIEHSGSRIVFTEQKCLQTVRAVVATLSDREVMLCRTNGDQLPTEFRVYEDELARQTTSPPLGEGSTDSVVQLLYTSGTTSRPKGVMLTNANFIYGSEVFRGATGLRLEDRHIISLPLFHAAAQCHALWPSLVTGCSVALMSRFSATRFFEQAVQYDATMAALFGAPLRMLLNQPSRSADSAHAIRNITFAQSLTAEQCDEWHQRFNAPLQQLWGMTETCSLPIMSPLVGERRLAAMGRPVVGYVVRIVNHQGLDCDIGESGELIVRGTAGRSIMKGYFKDPEATAETIHELPSGTWLYSGDNAYRDTDDFVFFVDRTKDLIKRSGENISSIEIESVIMSMPDVQDACVLGVPDPVRDENVVAVIVPKSSAKLSTEDVRTYCEKNLASFKVPQDIRFVDKLPRTSVGKIQKNVVRDELLETMEGNSDGKQSR